MITRSEKGTMALLATLVLLGGLYVLAGDLDPPGAPAPTMKTLDQVEPRIPLSQETTPGSPGYLYIINEPGAYYLTGDTTTSASGILVDADDVTIDLMGYTLRGDDTGLFDGGISIQGQRNVEIRNGTIRDFSAHGISETGTDGSNHRIIGVRIISIESIGIDMRGGDHLIQGCSVDECASDGIRVDVRSTVVDCAVTRCGADGISLGDDCVAMGNVCSGNGFSGAPQSGGIHVPAGSGNRIDGNQLIGNQVGVRCQTGQNLIIRNVATGNSLIDYSFHAGNSFGVALQLGAHSTNSNPWANLFY